MRHTIFLVIFLSSAMIFSQLDNCNCCTDNHKAFDFWIGDWSVTDSTGAVVGTNKIVKLQENCVLQENWLGASGSTGVSTNFYNSKTGLWEQLWVDNQGAHLKLTGNRIGNQMILSSEVFTHTDGNLYTNKITWTLNNDGTVRQLWQLIKDGSVVRVLFNGLYSPLKK